MTRKNAITIYDDIDPHPLGCGCGLCNEANAKSYGCSIKIVEGDNEEALELAIASDDIIDRVYACSPIAARHCARTRLEELGYLFCGDV